MAPQGPQQGQPQGAPQQGQPQGQQQGGDRNEASYKRLIQTIQEMVYAEQTVQAIKAQLQNEAPQEESIGMIVARVVDGIFKQIRQSGKNVPPTMMIRAVLETTAMVFELAVEGGFIEKEQANELTRNSFMVSMEMLGEANQDIDPNERQQYAGIVERLGGK